jgi:hypothetical protein
VNNIGGWNPDTLPVFQVKRGVARVMIEKPIRDAVFSFIELNSVFNFAAALKLAVLS